MHLNISSGKWRPSCLGPNVIIPNSAERIPCYLWRIVADIIFRARVSLHLSLTLSSTFQALCIWFMLCCVLFVYSYQQVLPISTRVTKPLGMSEWSHHFEFVVMCACWAHFICHHELWSTAVSHPFSSLNSSLGLVKGKHYPKITIPIFRLFL